jgi:CBS domain-containing protein
MNSVRRLLQIKGYDTWSISPNASVYQALRMMADKDIGALLVMEGEKLLGILSERDYARKIVLLGKTSKNTKVSEIMTDSVTVHPEQTVQECMQLMTEKRVRHLTVIENTSVVGVISIGDVVREIMYEQKESIKDLQKRLTVEKEKSTQEG